MDRCDNCVHRMVCGLIMKERMKGTADSECDLFSQRSLPQSATESD